MKWFNNVIDCGIFDYTMLNHVLQYGYVVMGEA